MREVALKHDFVSLTNGRMHVVPTGAGIGIVLLHGWPGLWFDYQGVLPLAAQLGRCIAPDFLGFGDSDAPSGEPIAAADEESFARDIVELLDAVGIDDAVVVGHDIGSAVGPTAERLSAGYARTGRCRAGLGRGGGGAPSVPISRAERGHDESPDALNAASVLGSDKLGRVGPLPYAGT
jgi:pimeloyl-ACP methyl ester carboxylesterase